MTPELQLDAMAGFAAPLGSASWGGVTVLNADCMAVMSKLADNAYDLAICDPPYGIERFKKGIGKGDRHTVKTTSTGWNNAKPSPEYFAELFRVSKNQIVWGANNFQMPESEYFCIWNKMQTVDNFASAEYAWVSPSLRQPALVFDYSIHQHNQTTKIHPTQKPEALYKWLLTKYAKPGWRILDTHLGSGSSAIAALELKYEMLGCEIDEQYFATAAERIGRYESQGTFDMTPNSLI
jgi:site-specific DNA-methyltransferase (adenine-specific)